LRSYKRSPEPYHRRNSDPRRTGISQGSGRKFLLSVKLSKLSPLEVVLEQKDDGESAAALFFSIRRAEFCVFLKIRRFKVIKSK
jgi:hypothetical protein